MKKIALICLFALGTSLGASAHDFTVTSGNNKLFFAITDQKAHKAEVTFEGSITQHNPSELEGEIRIPATVKHDNVVYDIVAIGPKALANATKLTSVILPSSIEKIGDFAFEGCTALQNVIFPSIPVSFGQGTFFRCNALRNLSFGSDWIQIDFSMFRWSDSLQQVRIPARIQKIQGLKTLRGLREIEVDANNQRYSSAEGALYDKDFKTLLCVPRAYSGHVNVHQGTTTILWGAMQDCLDIQKVTLPASLRSVSFREFQRLTKLQEIICQAEKPIKTATTGTQDTTLFIVANPAVVLYVPKAAVKTWKAAIKLPAGDYREIAANKPEGADDLQVTTPYRVEQSQMISQKNVKAIKK